MQARSATRTFGYGFIKLNSCIPTIVLNRVKNKNIIKFVLPIVLTVVLNSTRMLYYFAYLHWAAII